MLNFLHPIIIHADIAESRNEGSWERELDTFKQLKSVIFDGSLGEGDGVMINIFACLQSGGDGVYGVQNRVADPVA